MGVGLYFEIKRLYERIPSFECKKGCYGCCGPTPLSLYEAELIGIDSIIMPTRKKTLVCKFASQKGCKIYAKRPLLCRLFGVSTKYNMRCPKGGKPSRILTIDEENSIMNDYFSMFFGEGVKEA